MPDIKLYYADPSPPCRAVMMLGSTLGIKFDIQNVDLAKGETQTPTFLKLNPQHSIPVIDDNGFILQESRAILQYLTDAYGRKPSLYPKESKKRAVIHSRMYFETGILVPRFLSAYVSPIFTGKPAEEVAFKLLDEALQMLDTYLDTSKWAAGEDMTIADISLIATLTTVEVVGHKLSQFENLVKWMENCKIIPGYAKNLEGAEAMAAFVKSKQ